MRIALRPTLLAAALLLVGAPAAPQAQDIDDGVFIDEIKKDFLDKVQRFLEQGEWRSLFEVYNLAMTKHQQKLVRPDATKNVWIGVVEHLNQRFSALPPEALEYYRIENDGKAAAAYTKARAEGDRRGVQAVVERHFFATRMDEALDWLGNTYFEERRCEDAMFHWRRLLEHYPDSKIPKAVTAAKIGTAAVAGGNVAALEGLRHVVASKNIQGEVLVAGRKMALKDHLAALKIAPQAAMASSGAAKRPTVPEPWDRFERRLIGVRNDIKRWTADFAGDGSGGTPRRPQPGRQPQVAAQPEYPLYPAYGVVNGREMLIVTDGQRVMAVNPQKVTSASQYAGVYWRFPRDGKAIPRRNPSGRFSEYQNASSVEIGATIAGDQIFVTVFSEKKPPPQQNQNMPDLFDGPARLICFDEKGKVLWDTDEEKIFAALRKQEFFERNWAFSTPPVVVGDMVYVGLSSSPMAEPESRVLAFDRHTGELRWQAFLASVSGGVGRFFGGSGRWVTYVTGIVHDGGVIYAHSNLGTAAAIHAVSGNILWLSRYPRQGQRVDQWRGEVSQFIRYASRPHIHRGKFYVLPMDNNEMQVFDLGTGAVLKFPSAPAAGRGDLQWRNITQLVGTMEDWMILGGTESYVVNLVDRLNSDGSVRTPAGRAYSLPRSNVSRCGRGLIDGETIYFPTCEEVTGALSIYHGLGSFKNLDQVKWKEVGEYGNLLVAGDYLVVSTMTKVMVYTDVETIRKEFITRLVQSPPSPQAFLEHGDIMRQNERLVEAADSYLAFVDGAKGDSKWEKKVRDIKTELHDIFMKRGAEAFAQADPKQHDLAVDYYRAAKGFSYDEKTFAEGTRRLAESYEKVAAGRSDPEEKKELARKAVQEYQQIVEKSRDSYYKPEGGDVIQKAWTHAVARIKALGKEYGPEVLEPVEKAAKEELDRAADKGADALRRVIDLYPQTKAAVEAYARMAEEHVRAADWKKVVSTLREFKEKYPDQWTLDLQRKVTEALEKLGDWRRLWDELKKMGEQFGGDKVKVGEQEVTVREVVEKKLEEVKGRIETAVAALADPMQKLHAFDGTPTGGSRFELGTLPWPIQAAGEAPPAFTADLELVARGSTVELWDLKKKERVWAAAHPGGYLGAAYEDVKGGADPGIAIVDVHDGSPAQKAGLQAGDILLLVNGASVNAENADLVLGSAQGAVKLQWTRGGKMMEASVELAEWPASARPAVVGAAFTRDYAVAIAWEDGVATFDVATGKPGWVFRGVRDRFTLQRAAWTEGKILVHEHFRPDRNRSPFRQLSQQAQADLGGQLAYEEAYSRLLCLDDATGEVAWAKSFPFDAPTAQNHSVTIYAPRSGDGIAVLARSFRENVMRIELVLLSLADGKQKNPYSLNTMIASAVDEERGLFFYIEGNNRTLKSIQLWTPPKGRELPKPVDMPVQRYLDPNSALCSISVGKDYLLLSGSFQYQQPAQTPQYKVTVIPLRGGKEPLALTLPEDRCLPTMRTGIGAVADDGTVTVYNVPKSKVQGGGGSDRRAYLTTFRIVEEEKGLKAELIWDAVCPFLANPGGPLMDAALVALDDFLVLHAPRASKPGEGADQSLGLVYARKQGGYVRHVFDDLATPADTVPAKAMCVHRGRLFVQRKGSLDVWGN